MSKNSLETRFVFQVKDFQNSRDFYESILNLKIYKEWNHEMKNGRGVVYHLGGALLEILEADTNSLMEDVYIYIETKNIEEKYSRLKVLNEITIIQPLQTQPWGHINFMIRDPNGFYFKFFQQ